MLLSCLPLSDQVRQKLQTSLSSLRKQESVLSSQLHSALQASNTTHELNASSSGTTSAILSNDIDEVRQKVQRLERKKEEGGGDEVKAGREKVRECYL
jgi:altered-inheritance-of-mitochondria protein 13